MSKHYWFIFYQDKLLLKKKAEKYSVPFSQKAPVSAFKQTVHAVGSYDKNECFAFEAVGNPTLSKQYEWVDLRASFHWLDEKMFWLAGRASQLLTWDSNSRYCPVCGATTQKTAPNAKTCPQCKKEIYPVITPAIMVLIEKGDEILMVRGVNFKYNFFGLVAGFVEAGETLEECVKREVLEETNLKVKNLRYFTSRPWPFPSVLMIGFFAQYAGGTLKIDSTELVEAAFFHKDRLPALPGKISLARKMVQAWLKSKKIEERL